MKCNLHNSNFFSSDRATSIGLPRFFLHLRESLQSNPRHFFVLLDRLTRQVVFELNKLPNFDFRFLIWPMWRRSTIRPFDRFFARIHVDNPKAGDEFLRLRERTIDKRFLPAGREFDPRTPRSPVQPRQVEQNSRLRKLFVLLPHFPDQLLAQLLVCNGSLVLLLIRFHNHHESHRCSPYFCPRASCAISL